MATITIIPAKDNQGTSGEKKTIRVAAYCRVSTDRDAQESSYEIQKSHYTKLIQKTPGWVLAGIYADEGISGTSVKRRSQFKLMISDAENGLIDLIVTKSISRFARNTVDCLGYARILKSLGVPVYFEKENINTMDSGGEFLLTVMASLAQQESISLSQNVKLSLQYRYQQGKVTMGFSRFLGFDKDKNGDMIIIEDEAKIVRDIYDDFIAGTSYGAICRRLEESNIPSPAGGCTWYKETLIRMLKNEKYAGDAILQKTYTTDVLNKVREVNTGFVPQYFIRDHHEPIVSHTTWLRAQAEMRRRTESGSSLKLYCGRCDAGYRVYRGNKLMCGTRIMKGPRTCDNDIILLPEYHDVIAKAINAAISEGILPNETTLDYDAQYVAYTDLTVLQLSRRVHGLETKDIEKEKALMLEKIIQYEVEKAAIPRLSQLIEDGRHVCFEPSLMELIRKVVYKKNIFRIQLVGGGLVEVRKDNKAYPVRKAVKRKKKRGRG